MFVKVPQTLYFLHSLLVESMINLQEEVDRAPCDQVLAPSSCVYMSCVHIYPARAHVHFQASIWCALFDVLFCHNSRSVFQYFTNHNSMFYSRAARFVLTFSWVPSQSPCTSWVLHPQLCTTMDWIPYLRTNSVYTWGISNWIVCVRVCALYVHFRHFLVSVSLFLILVQTSSNTTLDTSSKRLIIVNLCFKSKSFGQQSGHVSSMQYLSLCLSHVLDVVHIYTHTLTLP